MQILDDSVATLNTKCDKVCRVVICQMPSDGIQTPFVVGMCMFDAYCVTDGYEIFSNDKDRDNKYMNVGEVTKDFKIGKPTRKGTSPTESLCHFPQNN